MTFVSDIIIHLWLFVAKTHDFGFDRQKQPFRGVLMNSQNKNTFGGCFWVEAYSEPSQTSK